MIIGDITKSYPGSEAGLIHHLNARARDKQTRSVLIIRADQEGRIAVLPAQIGHIFHTPTSPEQIAEVLYNNLILSSLSVNPTEPIEIVSFHSAVLSLASRFRTDSGTSVVALQWKTLTTVFSPVAPNHSAVSTPQNNWLPEQLDPCVDILISALKTYPNGLPQSGLRDLLSAISPTLDKKAGGPSIGQIVKHALMKGLVTIHPVGHVNPTVRLPESGTGNICAIPLENEDAQSVPVVLSSREVPRNDATREGGTRLETFRKCFRDQKMGPFSNERTIFFARLEAIVGDKKFSASSAIRRCARSVVEECKCSYPISAATDFLRTVADRNGIFYDANGEVLSPSNAMSLTKVVHSMPVAWIDTVEADMILLLVEKLDDVGHADVETIAYALFKNMSDENERIERVEFLIEKLASNGLLAEQSGRFHKVAPKPL